jgi:hypothetical protein
MGVTKYDAQHLPLQHTPLSSFIEEHVRAKFKAACDSSGQVPRPLHIRQVSSVQVKQAVPENMRKQFSEYPEAFPCTEKCLVLFQNIDGQVI